MEALLIGLIIGLGGSFLTALLVNSMGARLESKVQNLSHRWMQLPQRIVIYSGITLFSAAGLNYYLHQTLSQRPFSLSGRYSLLKRIGKALALVSASSRYGNPGIVLLPASGNAPDDNDDRLAHFPHSTEFIRSAGIAKSGF